MNIIDSDKVYYISFLIIFRFNISTTLRFNISTTLRFNISTSMKCIVSQHINLNENKIYITSNFYILLILKILILNIFKPFMFEFTITRIYNDFLIIIRLLIKCFVIFCNI